MSCIVHGLLKHEANRDDYLFLVLQKKMENILSYIDIFLLLSYRLNPEHRKVVLYNSFLYQFVGKRSYHDRVFSMSAIKIVFPIIKCYGNLICRNETVMHFFNGFDMKHIKPSVEIA